MNYRNARCVNALGWIEVEVESPNGGWIGCTIDARTMDMPRDQADILAVIGDDYEPFIEPTPEEIRDDLARDLRERRNRRLEIEVDSIACNPLRWGDLTDEQRQKVADHRRALLDVPQAKDFPNADMVWPELIF